MAKILYKKIRCCEDCPYLRFSDYPIGGGYWCGNDDFKYGTKFSENFNISKEVSEGCPLEDMGDNDFMARFTYTGEAKPPPFNDEDYIIEDTH